MQFGTIIKFKRTYFGFKVLFMIYCMLCYDILSHWLFLNPPELLKIELWDIWDKKKYNSGNYYINKIYSLLYLIIVWSSLLQMKCS